MRKLKLFVFLLLVCLQIPVLALTRNSSELINRKACSKIEVAYALDNGNIEKIECYDNYNDAKKKMNELEESNVIILERSSDVTRIIDAKYALAYLDKGKDALTYIYSNNNVKKSLTYMNNYKDYGATDAAYLELNYSNKAIKVRIGGVTGWIKNGEYYIIPVNWVKAASYYSINDKEIKHFYSKDIETTYSQSCRTLGPRPSFDIASNVYKSYDGIYFYSDVYTMIDDYRKGEHNLAVNKDNAYYNYYLYLPHRSKTNYSIDDIDSYIRNVLNFKGSLYAKTKPSNYSALYGSSEYFEYSEKIYGANALSVLSLSRNESANGTSKIAIDKNNIFGHNAVDGAAHSSSTGYLDIRSSIYSHGYGYINYGYAEVADSRYHGSHFGNKNTGMNVMYASDVYWGEKAANYYYGFDKDNGMLDYNYYQLVLSTSSNVNTRISPKTSAKIPFVIKQKDLPFILLDEVEGEEFKGSKIWYKIQADSNIKSDGSLIASNKTTWPNYNWDGAVYVHSSYLIKINESVKEEGKYHSPKDIVKDVNTYTIKTNANSTKYTPEVVKVEEDIPFFYTSTLMDKKGTIKKDSFLVVLEKVLDEEETRYLVITDYSTNQKAWINSEKTKLVQKDLLSVNVPDSGGYISLLDKPTGNVVLKSYSGNFLPIVGREKVGDKTFLKVQYKVSSSINYGYIDSSTSNISYTLNYLNTKPVIEVEDKAILINTTFNPLEDVLGIDLEDGDITKKIKVVKNSVNTSKIGSYEVTYELTDSYGDTVQETINVEVFKRDDTDALFMYNSLKHLENNIFEVSGFIAVKGMDNINITKKMIFQNQNTNEEFIFDLTSWKDYPYEMSSLSDKKAYNYQDGWFKNNLDLSSLPNGDYTIYVQAINDKKEAKTLFTNIAYMDMTRRCKGKDKEYLIEIDYSTLNSPLLFSVRNSLLSLDVPETLDPMYNFFDQIKIDNNKLSIRGTSHNIGVNLGIKDDVERTIVLENIETFQRYEFNLGSITNGDYPIKLAVPDNLDKTRAWYDNTFDLSNVLNGQYAFYIKNKVNNKTFYGEIIDVAYTDFSSINNKNYVLRRNDDIRLRLELVVNK